MALVGCDDNSSQNTSSDQSPQTSQSTPEAVQEKIIQAISPEKFFDIPFTKTESGRVLLNNAVDLFRHDYDVEDKTIIVQSENPLKLTLKEYVLETLEQKEIRNDLERKFISNVFEIFAHLNVDSVELTFEPIKQNGKPYGKNVAIKGKITRENALKVLQAYSAMKSFDDYVSFDKDDAYNILGYSRSKRANEFNQENYRKQILTGLLTNKIEPPYEMVQQPIDVDVSILAAKMVEVGKSIDIYPLEDNTRELTDGKTERTLSLSKISALSFISNRKGEVLQINAQFGFVSDQNLIVQAMAVLGVASLAVPEQEKTFKAATAMIEKIGKKLKKSEGTIKESQNIAGYTVTMTVHKVLGGLSFFTIEKLEKKPVTFE